MKFVTNILAFLSVLACSSLLISAHPSTTNSVLARSFGVCDFCDNLPGNTLERVCRRRCENVHDELRSISLVDSSNATISGIGHRSLTVTPYFLGINDQDPAICSICSEFSGKIYTMCLKSCKDMYPDILTPVADEKWTWCYAQCEEKGCEGYYESVCVGNCLYCYQSGGYPAPRPLYPWMRVDVPSSPLESRCFCPAIEFPEGN